MRKNSRVSASELANLGAQLIQEAHLQYRIRFDATTKGAGSRFGARMWRELHADADRRLNLYSDEVDQTVLRLQQTLRPRDRDRIVWAALKAVYSGLHIGRPDRDVAETFFNSVSRRVFSNVGVDPDIEFVHGDADVAPSPTQSIVRRHSGDIETQIKRTLTDSTLADLLTDLEADVRRVTQRVEERLGAAEVEIVIVRSPFFREQGAYLVGRIETQGRIVPLVLCIRNGEEGARVDAVLMDDTDVSILFGFTRSHFMVDAGPPVEIVRFLRTLMPKKRVAELYVSIGEFKHGKTELFRDLLDHLETSSARFESAPGIPGLVMHVFGIPDYDIVIKVIRDRFPPPKQTTRRQVMNRYRFVFRNDRAGRLVEAHEFEHLSFPIERFEPHLLAELIDTASNTVRMQEDEVTIDHAYLERRVEPLDLHLDSSDSNGGAGAVRDYARAIEELAYTDIFCGDVLPKNFGLTRNGRVVFYDYDELDLVSTQRFRPMPTPRDIDDEMSNQPWFGFGPRDVFPSDWIRFLGLSATHRQLLEKEFGHLFDHQFWRDVQNRVATGEPVEILPYAERTRV